MRRTDANSENALFGISPQHVKERGRDLPRRSYDRFSLPQREMRQWREKYPKAYQEQEVNSPVPRTSVIEQEMVLQSEAQAQFQTPQRRIPSREEIIEELHETTRQYVNCPDPVESAARRQRVLQGDAQGDTEEAADRLLAVATARIQAENTDLHQQPVPSDPHVIQSPEVVNLQGGESLVITHNSDGTQREDIIGGSTTHLRRTNRQRTKPAKLRSTGTSPNPLQGACSKKRNFSRAQGSPARTSPTGPRGREANSQRTGAQRNEAGPLNAGNQPTTTLIPSITKKKKDFHAPQRLAP